MEPSHPGRVLAVLLTTALIGGCTLLEVESTKTSTEKYQGAPVLEGQIRQLQEEQARLRQRLDALERKVNDGG